MDIPGVPKRSTPPNILEKVFFNFMYVNYFHLKEESLT